MNVQRAIFDDRRAYRDGEIHVAVKAEIADCARINAALGWLQLVDDLLDYDGETHELGKNVGDDLREGKPTLPLLVAMERGTDADRQVIRHAIEHGEVERRVRNAHTTRAMITLAIMGVGARVDDLNKHLSAVGGRWLVGVLRDATAGAHVPIDRPMRELISDTERFITWLRAHEPNAVRT